MSVPFHYERHAWVAARTAIRPPQGADESVGFNGRVAAAITKYGGTMPTVYAILAIQIVWMVLASAGVWVFRSDPYPFAFLLFLSNCVQLPLMFVVMVGQQVLGGAADKRAVQTYKDAEAVLHEADEMQRHLLAQDAVLNRLVEEQKRVLEALISRERPE